MPTCPSSRLPSSISPTGPTGPIGQSAARSALAAVGAAALAALLAGATAVASAQQPLSQASVESLVSALSAPAAPAGGGLATRSFRRTQLPDSGSNLCGAEAGKPAPRPAGSSGGNAAGTGRVATRTLEVVPYAGDTTPGVNLSVQFATGSDRLAAADRQLLDNVATALKAPALAEQSFAIAGHTDASGDARINLELSCARALAVRRYLVERGVAETRLSAYGFGSARPLQGDDAAAANRRVEVRRAPQ